MSYGPDKDYGCVVWPWLLRYDLALVQGHDTPLGHGQELFKKLFISNMTAVSYGPDKGFSFVCTVTLEIWPWIKVMTHPGVEDNNGVK